MGMSKLQVIKSNACLLYHKEASIRLEATSRLAWYIRYTGVVTSVLSDLCVTPCNRSSLLLDVYEESSVTRVLELLSLGSHGSSPDEESQVRFSCLTQLSVMMDDVKLHRAFLTNGGVTLIVRELHELLTTNLPDRSKGKQSIGCCVRVLRNVCENSSGIRQYLGSEYNLLVDIIKVLFLHPTCRSDAVQLLFILLYADYVLNSGEEDGSVVSVPVMIRQSLHVPDTYSGSHWCNSPHTLPDETEQLLSRVECKQHLIIHWNLHHYYEGDIYKLLRHGSPSASNGQESQSLYDQMDWISELLLSKQNLLSLITSSPRNLTHHTLLFIQLLKLVTKIIATHPDRVHDYESLTQSVLVCIEQHEQMDSSMVNICLEYLSLILYHSPNTKSLDTQCLWSLLIADSNIRARTDLVLSCLNLILSNILTDSVVSYIGHGVHLDFLTISGVSPSPSSPPFPSPINNTRGSINNTSTGDSINANTRGSINNTRGSVTYSMGSVKACAYHLISGLCSNRGSVTALLHNIPRLVDDALRDVVRVRNADLVAQCAAMCCANMASFSTSEILLRKCIDENFFTKVIPILSNPRSSSLKSAVCLLVNNLFNLNPGLLAQTDPMVQLICVLMSEMTKYCSTPLTTELTELCSSMSRILTLYFSLNPEVPLISDKFTSALIYILNASSYDGDISVPSRDSLWRLSLSLLSSLPLPPALPPTVVSVLCHLLRTDKPQTARSILNTLPRLVPHLNPDNLEPLCHVVFSLWSHKFKPCPALVNSVLALTSRRGPQHGPLLLEYDILDDVHVRLKQFYVSLECSHGDNVLCTEMDIYLQLLNNILCQHPRVCEIAAKEGLADTLHKLLGWVLTSETTLSALLQVMASFTSNCLQGAHTILDTNRTILDQILSHASHPGLENAHFNSLTDLAKAYDTVLLEELIRIVKRNATLIVWNLAANNYKTKLHFRHIGLVNCLQNCAKVDEDFREEYGVPSSTTSRMWHSRNSPLLSSTPGSSSSNPTPSISRPTTPSWTTQTSWLA
ncbi:uncharacterized protein LOC103515041 [Diaphorina citri]|uniref:Uncharacterized protein LOC103515041 n=1 Tax=Diaphorina citri TaxID=121845 RepID=A0A3Q0J5F5_DIACI|nr:uncharacterized protein LOC103515041 [Diaphorina citri]